MKKQPNTDDIERELRSAIQRELMRCDPDVTPNLCQRLRTLDGYRAVEDTIINMAISQGLMPSACVALLDSEYSDQ